LDIDLKGGDLVDCPLIGVPSTAAGSLSALEIDPASALNQFKGIVDNLIGMDDESSTDTGLRNTLRDLEEIFDTLPAGTDEVVALAKIVNLVKKGDFDRIVLDTAPTGHTLRMLSTPGFLADLIDRLLNISDKVNSNSMVRMLLSASRSDDIDSAAAAAKSKLLSFQLQMYDLEDLFSDAKQTEFLIVTLATELAARESIRLLNDLTFEAPDMPIKVRNVVINQVLQDSDAKTFLDHVSGSQARSIQDLEQAMSSKEKPPRITKARYLDTEPRGVFGLKVLADELTKVEEAQTAN
jgi:arsenite-transporting ATPase